MQWTKEHNLWYKKARYKEFSQTETVETEWNGSMEEIELTLEDNLKLKESIEWGFNYYTEELKELGYSHQVKDNNELEIFDEEGNFVGKSFLEKEGLITTRKFEATTGIQEQVAVSLSSFTLRDLS